MLALATACGEADSTGVQPPSDEAEQESVTDPPASEEGEALAFALEGYASDDSGASAQLLVREDDGVRLTISGGLEADGYLLMTLQLTELEAVLGEHDWDLGLPSEAVSSIMARLDGVDYYSQGGLVHMALDRDGHIEGDFSVDLALHPTEETLVPFRVRPEFETVSGNFAGDFSLSCYSRVPAHRTWLAGGSYCEELGL